jgi:hypothetical protein
LEIVEIVEITGVFEWNSGNRRGNLAEISIEGCEENEVGFGGKCGIRGGFWWEELGCGAFSKIDKM